MCPNPNRFGGCDTLAGHAMENPELHGFMHTGTESSHRLFDRHKTQILQEQNIGFFFDFFFLEGATEHRRMYYAMNGLRMIYKLGRMNGMQSGYFDILYACMILARQDFALWLK